MIIINDQYNYFGFNNFQLTGEIWLVLDELLVTPWPDWLDWRLHPWSQACIHAMLDSSLVCSKGSVL